MKINQKDVASGAFLILLAAAGLYLNLDHNLGNARRMGPGYMPMLVFLIQAGLGGLVLFLGLFNGPDPLEKWSKVDWTSLALSLVVGSVAWYVAAMVSPFFSQGYNGMGFGLLVAFVVMAYSAGWRLLAWISASMCVFALLLEKGGLMAACVGTVGIAAIADPQHHRKPLGVLGMIVFLSALCWWIFIKELDIRVAVWPQF